MDEDRFKPLYKSHRKVSFDDLTEVFDPSTTENAKLANYDLRSSRFEGTTSKAVQWTCDQLQGLRILTNVLSIDEQKQLVKESVVNFLESSEHLTNLDAHYELTRPIHMFGEPISHIPEGKEKDKLVRDKLRWVTLGGQYNWTTKVYPSFEPGTPGCPLFPESLTKDVSTRLGMRPEAAIVNYYSEGDILSPHQDVAELTKEDLVSISIGCTCIFYVGTHRYGNQPLPVLLRSGDIVIMGGDSRFAYHGVGRVFGGTTPPELLEIEGIIDPAFRQWMSDHRININVRQMRE